jgi:hypothetical protein
MNKWNEIIKLCIEQIEKDEENAKNMVEIRTDDVTIVKLQEIEFILAYIDTLLSILYTHPTYNVLERIEDVRSLVSNLKE